MSYQTATRPSDDADSVSAPPEAASLGAAAHIASESAQSEEAGPSGERARRIRGMFGAIAHAYDLNNHLLSLNTDKRWRRAAVREALRGREDSTSLALDCCTGTGDLAFEIAGRLRTPGARVIGADFCPPMLEQAAKKVSASDAGAMLPEFMAGDTMSLPFDDDVFDVAMVAFGIRNVADPAAGLREMTRVARPGGRVVVLEFTPIRSPLLRWSYRVYFERILPWLGGMISRRPDAYRYLAESVEEFPDCEGLKAVMEAAGLRDVAYRRLSFGIAALHWGEKSALASTEY